MDIASLFTLEDLGDDVWRAWTPPGGSGRPDIFGGQVAGQALLAASRTVDPAHHVNSVHCSFLRRGQPALPLDIVVERTRTGRTYTNRRIAVSQDDRLIFTMMASFHAEEPGDEYVRPMPAGVADPDDLPAPPGGEDWDSGIETRSIDIPEPTMQYWCRTTGDFPTDPTLHEAGLLYLSDLRAGSAAMVAVGIMPYGPPPPGSSLRLARGMFGSLDHALWFHRRPRIDDWFFCEVQPIVVRDARGLVLGTMFDRAGNHIATFTQEMFLKPEAEPAPETEG